ncbi:MAG: glutamate formiminotransferase, partial [Oscillospiraceae bacterium]
DYTKTSMYSVFEMVKMEARRYGVQVVGSEVVGILPMQALVDCAEYYLQIEDFSVEQVLEYHI